MHRNFHFILFIYFLWKTCVGLSSHMWCRQEIMKIHFGLCFGIFISFSSCHTQKSTKQKIIFSFITFFGSEHNQEFSHDFQQTSDENHRNFGDFFVVVVEKSKLCVFTKQLKYITLRCQLRITRNIFWFFFAQNQFNWSSVNYFRSLAVNSTVFVLHLFFMTSSTWFFPKNLFINLF